MDTLAYPFLKRFLFSFRGTPRVLYHIYGSIRFNVYPLDRDNALFLSLFEVTFGNPRSKRFLPLRSWIETRPRTNVALNGYQTLFRDLAFFFMIDDDLN